MALYNPPLVGGYNAGLSGANRSIAESQGTTQSTGYTQAGNQAQAQSTSFIPDYSQTPILESIAKWAGAMAPQVYDWGMQQYANNQGNINNMMDIANSWASPQRIASDMGMAEAGVAQAGAQGLENAKRDLESFGLDPSAGRYAGLDRADAVKMAAEEAGAGNQQRNVDISTSQNLRSQAQSASEQNMFAGIQGENAGAGYAGVGMQLKYGPLGTQSSSQSSGYSMGANQSTGQNTSYNIGAPQAMGGGSGGGGSGGGVGGTSMPNDSSPFNSKNQGGMGPGAQYGPGPDQNRGGTAPPQTFGGGQAGVVGTQSGDPASNGYVGPGMGGFSTPDSGGGGTSADVSGGASYGGYGGSDTSSTPADTSGYFAQGGAVGFDNGGGVDPSMSPSNGADTDDVPASIDGQQPARLNAGEFVIPKDVVAFKGFEYFYKLMEQSRKNLAMMQQGGKQQGFNAGGDI